MPDLPPAIAAYFAAPTDADSATLGQIFTPDAHVHDENHAYDGIDAIRAWRIETQAKTPFTARPVDITTDQAATLVRVEVSGAFPNSPVLLDHRFALAGGRIASLDIR
ncbi:MAG: nuclear transport factor 2 family protein [Sphingomonas sp.]|uniref:nuclear transport factor 2 family protein n=1 Tax=Sphingomonas sp. TaxID=28214 RepID=UPI0030FA10B2